MVVLHLKCGGGGGGGGSCGDDVTADAFLYETRCATPIDALIRDLVRARAWALGAATSFNRAQSQSITHPQVWVWNTRLRLRVLACGLRSLVSPPAADGDERTVAMPSPAAAASATLERVASDIEAYLSKVKAFLFIRVASIQRSGCTYLMGLCMDPSPQCAGASGQAHGGAPRDPGGEAGQRRRGRRHRCVRVRKVHMSMIQLEID